MPGGRPTSDPRAHLVAVRLADRHLRLLRDRARREGISLSEALRRFLDACLPSPQPPRARRPTPEEQRDFDAVFAALGLGPARRKPRAG
jgi:hypothetical protein